jgi:hypothetical protein
MKSRYINKNFGFIVYQLIINNERHLKNNKATTSIPVPAKAGNTACLPQAGNPEENHSFLFVVLMKSSLFRSL